MYSVENSSSFSFFFYYSTVSLFHIFRPFWLLEMRNISVVGERELLDIFASVPIQLCQNVAA